MADHVILVAHELVTGPIHDLHQYLLQKSCREILYIHHPLQPFSPFGDHRSILERYENGRGVDKKIAEQWKLPRSPISELIHFARHAGLTLVWCFQKGRGAKLYIGMNPLNAWIGLWLRKMGIVQKVIYYTIDYVPNRFSNRSINAFYHWIDRSCVEGADQVWNLSSRMIEARERRGVSSKHRSKQITVPIGTDLSIPPQPADQIERWTVVYFGGLMEKQGVQLGIEALALLKKKFSQARLLVIGGGTAERTQALHRLAQDLGVAESVEFTGVIEDHTQALRRISECAVAIAPYTDDPDNFTRYTDPGKPKAYLAAGLPVVMTDVPEVAAIIERHGAGKVISYSAESLAEALAHYLEDESRLLIAKNNARRLAEQYCWSDIFDRAFSQGSACAA